MTLAVILTPMTLTVILGVGWRLLRQPINSTFLKLVRMGVTFTAAVY